MYKDMNVVHELHSRKHVLHCIRCNNINSRNNQFRVQPIHSWIAISTRFFSLSIYSVFPIRALSLCTARQWSTHALKIGSDRIQRNERTAFICISLILLSGFFLVERLITMATTPAGKQNIKNYKRIHTQIRRAQWYV